MGGEGRGGEEEEVGKRYENFEEAIKPKHLIGRVDWFLCY